MRLNISSWSSWIRSSDNEDAPFDLKSLPLMQRRRLNTQGKSVAAQISKQIGAKDIPIVYASRHGDIERTLLILKEIASSEPVSPMQFSLSVHNAIPSLISVCNKTHSTVTSIASGDESVIPALLEAAGMLKQGNDRVLCVFADVSLPDEYNADKVLPASAYACAILLTTTELPNIELVPISGCDKPYSLCVQPLKFIDFLESNNTLDYLSHNQTHWEIRKIDI